MRIYIAAPWDHRDDARNIAAKLTSKGHTITHDWWNYDVPDQDIDGLRKCALDDWLAVLGCEVFLLINNQKRGEETSGKAIETGIALAYSLAKMYAVGKPTNVFHYLKQIKWFDSVEEAIAAID